MATKTMQRTSALWSRVMIIVVSLVPVVLEWFANVEQKGMANLGEIGMTQEFGVESNYKWCKEEVLAQAQFQISKEALFCMGPPNSPRHRASALTFHLQKKGKHNPMHNLHNTIFPLMFVLKHCIADRDKDRMVALVPPTMPFFGSFPAAVKTLNGLRPDHWGSAFTQLSLAHALGNTSVRHIDDKGFGGKACFDEGFLAEPVWAYRSLFGEVLCKASRLEKEAQKKDCQDAMRTTWREIGDAAKSAFGLDPSAQAYGDPGAKIRLKVYDRSDVNSRRWLNVREFAEALEATDLDIELEMIPAFNEMSLLAQCRVFYDADIVILPHSGAAGNAICSRAKSAVLEISKKCDYNEARWLKPISDALELRYVEIGCVHSTPDVQKDFPGSFKVDPQLLLEQVRTEVALLKL